MAHTEDVPIDSLVAIAEFGEAIYPGLRRLGSVDRGGDKPSHVVIKGENYHALEALQFTHAGHDASADEQRVCNRRTRARIPRLKHKRSEEQEERPR